MIVQMESMNLFKKSLRLVTDAPTVLDQVVSIVLNAKTVLIGLVPKTMSLFHAAALFVTIVPIVPPTKPNILVQTALNASNATFPKPSHQLQTFTHTPLTKTLRLHFNNWEPAP